MDGKDREEQTMSRKLLVADVRIKVIIEKVEKLQEILIEINKDEELKRGFDPALGRLKIVQEQLNYVQRNIKIFQERKKKLKN